MENNNFLPMGLISECLNSTLLPVGRDYTLYDYNKCLTHLEILKERIRQEMYAEKALEEELRREILMENALLIPKMMLPNQFNERGFNEGIVTASLVLVNNGVTETVPFQRGPNAMVPKVQSFLPESANERLYTLPRKPKGSSNVRIGFGNAENRPATQVKKAAATGFVKANKRNLFCNICGIHSTSSQSLRDHVQGKRHQAKAKLKVKNTNQTGKRETSRKTRGKESRSLSDEFVTLFCLFEPFLNIDL